MKTNIKNMKVKGTSLILIILMLIGMMPQLATPVYAGELVYDITFYHDSIYYGQGSPGHLTGSSTEWDHPTWGNDTWVGSGKFRPKVYYEAGNDHFTLKVNISRVNGAFQPGGNYVSGTVKYNGHTITFENWGPFDCGSDWVDIRFERTAITFNYNGGRNHTQGTNNISADYYWYNSNNFSIVDTYKGKNFDIENQPYWTAYPPVSSDTIFGGWWTEPTGGTRITTEDITKLSGTMTLYAHWEPYHLVQLVGGTNVTPSRGYIDVEGCHTTQVVQGEEMEPVTFTANEGYHIDHNSIDDVMQHREGTDKHTQNGVTVERISDTQYVAYGTPTGQVHIWIPNGHKYENWTTTTAATCTTVGAKERVCKYDATIKETAEVAIDPNAHSWGEWTIEEPTCSAPGEKTHVCQHNAEHTETIAGDPINPDAHSYKFVDFTWTGSEADGYTEAVANYVCENNSEHKTTAPATVSEGVVTDPTCGVGGKTTYTATVTSAESPDGVEHTESKDANPTEAIGHKWMFSGFTWTGDEKDGYTAVVANYVCEHDDKHEETVDATIGEVVLEPTCTEPGKTTYTATIEAEKSLDGEKHTDNKDAKATDPIKHSWKFVDFTWTGSEAEGYTAAVANYVCENNENHKETVAATISESVLEPTCTEPGKTTYKATVEAEKSLDSAEHTDNKDAKPTEAIDHSWKFVDFTWTGNETDGYTEAVANYVCENDENHKETAAATISEVVLMPTCIEPGKTTYTAIIEGEKSLDGAEHTDSKDAKATDPIDHDWGEPTYTWSDDNSSVTATRECKRDAAHKETETVSATSEETIKPTCTEKGELTYTSAAFENSAFDVQTKKVEVDALGHKWGEWEVMKEATETEEGSKTHVCQNNPEHTETEIIPKLDPITYNNVEGEGSTWTEGSGESAVFTFKRSRDDGKTFEHFDGIKVDDKAVAESNYTAEPGSVIIKLKPAYLETLSVGEHTLTALFDDGSDVTVSFEVAEKQTTPDDKKSDTTPDDKKSDTTPDNKKSDTTPDDKKSDTTPDNKKSDTKPSESNTSPRTGDSSNMFLYVILLVSAALLTLVIYVTRKHRKA